MKKSKQFWAFIVHALLVYTVVQVLITVGILNQFYSNTLIFMAINIMLAVSLHLVIGITGQFSLGHAGFLAVGAYISAIVTMKLHLPFPVAILAAGLVATISWINRWNSKFTVKRGLSSDCNTWICRNHSNCIFKY